MNRINEELLRELSSLLPTLKDPRFHGMVSVVHVEASPDLRTARVAVSVLGSEEDQESVRRALHSASGYLRREIGRRVKLRYTPELQFEIDHSMEAGAHILSLLRTIEQEDSYGSDDQ